MASGRSTAVKAAARQRVEKTQTRTKPRELVLAWPLWAAAILTVFYLAAHFAMIPDSMSLWGGLLSALVLGQ